MKTYIILIIGLFLGVSTTVQAVNVGDNAPSFTLTADNGGNVSLSDYQGKVVFLFLFGNTCPTCIANGPNTESAIYQELKSNSNFVALGIDVWQSTQSKVASFKASTSITYPLLLNGGSVASTYATQHDRVIVIDQNGVVRYKSSSQATSTVLAQAKTVIDNLLTTASIDEPQHDAFKVYVDRRSQDLVFNTPYSGYEKALLRVMDMSGRIVYEANENVTGENRIPFQPASRGVFFLSIHHSEGHTLHKFLY